MHTYHNIPYHNITLHTIAYHYIPLHYITYICIYIYMYIYTHIDIDIDIPKYRSGYPMISPDMTRYDNDMPLFPQGPVDQRSLAPFAQRPASR